MGRFETLSSDSDAVAKAIRISALLMWLPHVAALIYTGAQGAVSATYAPFLGLQLLAAVGATYYSAVHLSGDYLMAISGLIGLLVEISGFGMGEDTSRYALPNNFWIAITAFHGLFAGILCKAKDIHDGRYYRGYSIAERLYVVFPFAIGLWFGYIVNHGWSGVWTVFISIFFCLTTVGYGVVAHRIMRWVGVFDADLIELITRLFTSSFGAVLFTLAGTLFAVVYLAVPFITALWSLNALISSVGIIVEVVVYDIA
jgi:hypothetical protein